MRTKREFFETYKLLDIDIPAKKPATSWIEHYLSNEGQEAQSKSEAEALAKMFPEVFLSPDGGTPDSFMPIQERIRCDFRRMLRRLPKTMARMREAQNEPRYEPVIP